MSEASKEPPKPLKQTQRPPDGSSNTQESTRFHSSGSNSSNSQFSNNLKDIKFKPLSGIDAVHINSARDMVKLHTRDRLPPDPSTRSPNSASRTSSEQGKPFFKQFSKPPKDLMSSSFPRSSPKPPSTNVSVPAKTHNGPCNNPQCTHCGAVIIPSPKSSLPIKDEPSITINDWSIYTIKRPILNSKELDDLEARFSFPLPEMIFGNNSVKLVNDKTQSIIEFNALDALDSIDSSSDLKVSYHQQWLEARKTNSLSTESHDITAEKASKENGNRDLTKYMEVDTIKNYDWTYSTNYKGTVTNMNFSKTDEKFPIDRLLRPDPILFFDESILFEDELGDNGISILSTKIRVMPTCLLLLCRLFLRIDNVIFRVRDTRVFVDFETNQVLREYKEQDAAYNDVLSKVSLKATNDPKALLRDPNRVSQNIPVLRCELETNTIQ